MQFKAGDIIVGKKEYKNEYYITSYRRGMVGKILETRKDFDDIFVLVLETKDGQDIGETYWVHSEYFELQKSNLVTIEKLRR